MNRPLVIILITVLLDIIWLWMVIPILPFIVEWFGFSEFYIGLTFATFSFWMLVWWLIFWRLSDKIWRNRTLEMTVFLNIVWYLVFALSTNLYMFIIARFIWWLAASWFAVWQAYISDISDEDDRTKNMALVWAVFWVGFIIWPVFWGILSSLWNSLNIIWYVWAFLCFLNLLLVMFYLPKVKIKKPWIIKEFKFDIKNPLILLLFLISFIVAIGFSSMQSTFWSLMNDRFEFTSKDIWYLFWFIGLTAIIYQAKVIWFVKSKLSEPKMVIFWLSCLTFSFLLFSINHTFWAIFFIIFLFPIWHWTVNPTIASMHSKLWAKHVWKLLWINTSMVSLWNIIWPFLAGSLYLVWDWLPYIVSSIFFVAAIILIGLNYKKY